MSQLEKEFHEYDQQNLWPLAYQKIRNESTVKSIEDEYSVSEARKPENRSKNRYRDVNPYDHSRVVLQTGEDDYINANLLEVPEANRKYILTQGPLEHTSGQLWQMIWEQNSRGIVMLNRVMEKGRPKCHQYYPQQDGDEEDQVLVFEDVGLKVSVVDELKQSHFIIRKLELEHIESQETREVIHYQYITWPDFGVPSSPKAFLNFLMAVRESGMLESDVGPAVIHCSAGIGRSGTFCLVDSCLIMIEKSHDLDCIDVKEVLLDMRQYRMGLIQTPEQLRFSYLSIIVGGRQIVGSQQEETVESVLDNYLQNGEEEDKAPPPPVRTTSLNPNRSPPPLPPKRGPSESPARENPSSPDSQPPEKQPRVDIDGAQGDIVHPVTRNGNAVQVEEVDLREVAEEVAEEDDILDGVPNYPIEVPKLDLRGIMDTDSQASSRDSLDSGRRTDGAETEITSENITQDSQSMGAEIRDSVKVERDLETSSAENSTKYSGSRMEASVGKDHVGSSPDVERREHLDGVASSSDAAGLRKRQRQLRRVATQELIQRMKEKQKQSETWKKRKSYFKPIAIGLTILLGGFLLYRYYWSS